MTTKYTPGPWKANLETYPPDIASDAGDVAGCFETTEKEEQEANATLISAAPEMLAALQQAVARVELANAEGDQILSAWLPEARAAIAKAEGRGEA